MSEKKEKCDTTMDVYNPSAICCDISVGWHGNKTEACVSATKTASDNSKPSKGQSLTMFSTVNKDLYREVGNLFVELL